MGGISRNSPCECGSGKKYKQCCLGKTESRQPPVKLFIGLAAAVVLGVICGFIFGWGAGARVGVISMVVVGLGSVLIKPPGKKRDRSSGSNIDFGR